MCTTSLLPRLILSLLLSLFLSACGGGDPTEGDSGAQGATGKNALMNVSVEPSGGGHCAVSGSKIDAGLDVNANGVLDANEVSSTQYLCSGTAGGGGANALVQMLDEPSGTNCAAGGKTINVGLDGNANGMLEASEISSSGYVCNGSGGADGVGGANGTNGSNGTSSPISIASEPVGANCAYGGIKISSAATTNYSCHGAPSADLNWVIVDDTNSPKQALRNTNYIATGDAQVVLTLPADADLAVGDVIRINGAGAGGWKIAQNDGQAVHTKYLAGGIGGAIWTAREADRTWQSVASSADGSKLVAAEAGGLIYTSNNFGATWTPRDIEGGWVSVASSADGTKLVAATYLRKFYTSSDSGVTWTAPEEAERTWASVASSADGSKLVAAADGQILTWDNFGATWTPHEPGRDWNSVASSADGSKLVAVARGGQIGTSDNFGATWAVRESDWRWQSVASSADGNKLVAVAEEGVATSGSQIYTSTDGGASWTGHESWQRWNSVASSADGSKLVVTAWDGQIYTSTDSGANWTPRDSDRFWLAVASSADGSKLVAAVSDGQIYTSTGTTTFGTSGSISGGASDTIELQYVGNSMFIVLSQSGSPTAQ